MDIRPKLTIEEQIQWMKSKGITFNVYSEDQAISFLRDHTYFFKLKAFNKDYLVHPATKKYIGLDFAYLVELSTLDMHFRRLILHATLDLEHFLKVRLLNSLSDNPEEDGYTIVKELFSTFPFIKSSISQKSENSMCKDLIKKIIREDYPIWNVVEVLSFGDFVRLYEIYDHHNKNSDRRLVRNLFSVRCLRNAAAHNNCLLNSLHSPYTRKIHPDQYLSRQVSQLLPSEKSREKKMKNPVIHDFIALLFVYRYVVTSHATVQHFSEELHDLFDQRMQKHRDFFEKNESLTSSYRFVKGAVDKLYPLAEDNNEL